MPTNKQIILIPYWIQEILKRNQMELSDCLQFEKLKPIVSLNDLIAFDTLQRYASVCVGMDEPCLGSLFLVWIKSIPQGAHDAVDYLTKNICALEDDPSFHIEVKSRLFVPEAKMEQYSTPFTMYDLSSEVAGVVIYPGFFGDKTDEVLQMQLVESILKVLYVYSTYSEVSETPLFRRYLQLLSKKSLIV